MNIAALIASTTLFAALAQELGAPPKPAVAQIDLHDRAQRSLARDPRALPNAAENHWTKWGPKDSVPAELQSDLGAGVRAYTAADYGSSLAYLYAVLDREPEYPAALYQAGSCYFRLRRYGDAVVMLERFIRVAPQEIAATQALGHCYYSLGDYERARAHYEKVLAPAGTSPEALRGLALCEWRLHNAKRAIELLNKVLELRPEHADAHAWLAQVLFDEGDNVAALVHAERARDLEPWDPKPWFLLSRLYTELDRTSDAEVAQKRFDTASLLSQQVSQQEGLLLHDPLRAEVWRELIALQRTGANKGAVKEALPHLVALGPLDSKTALTIVDSYEWLGDKEHALRAAQYAESRAGSDKQTWLWLADFYRRTKDVAGAERAQKVADALH